MGATIALILDSIALLARLRGIPGYLTKHNMLATPGAANHDPQVRKLFRDKTTGEFLCGNGKWTIDPKLAFDFIGDPTTALPWNARGLRAGLVTKSAREAARRGRSAGILPA